jgi:hypothetical protein
MRSDDTGIVAGELTMPDVSKLKAPKAKKPKAKKPAVKKKKAPAKAKAKKTVKKVSKPKVAKKKAVTVTRPCRQDLRLSKAEKAKLTAKAKATRRTVTSIIAELIEKMK